MENEKSKEGRNVIVKSILLSVLAGIVFGIASLVFARQFLSLMGADEQVIDVGIHYFRVVAIPSVVISLFFMLGAILRGAGDTKTPMRIGIWMNVFHIVLDYVLIYGVFFHGFGIAGAAVATVAAQLVGVLLLFSQLYKKGFMQKRFSIEWSIFSGIIRLATPAAAERLFMRAGQIVYFGMIVRMGTNVYAAHTLAGNFTIFSTIVGTGFAAAIISLIGKHIGLGQLDEVRTYSKISMRMTSVIMTFVVFLVCLGSIWGTHLFTSDAGVISLIITVLFIDVIAQPATGVVTALTAILQAGGDTKYPMYVTAIGIWCIRTLGVYILGVKMGFGLPGAWTAIALDNYVRAFLLWQRYNTLKWIKKI